MNQYTLPINNLYLHPTLRVMPIPAYYSNSIFSTFQVLLLETVTAGKFYFILELVWKVHVC